MKRTDSEMSFSLSRQKPLRFLIALGLLYMMFIVFEVPFVLKNRLSTVSLEGSVISRHEFLNSKPFHVRYKLRPERKINELSKKTSLLSGLNFTAGIERENGISNSATRALDLGRKIWRKIESMEKNKSADISVKKIEVCPNSISMTGDEFFKKGSIMTLPCGLTLGSHLTVNGKPSSGAHAKSGLKKGKQAGGGDRVGASSQFMMELQALKMTDGEDRPKIMHFNPRLRGDWIGEPVIEINSCFRMQWGSAQRCRGWGSRPGEETVDGLVKCEKWRRNGDNGSEWTVARWLNQLLGRKEKATFKWPFPFADEKLFVLTLSAGLEGYHISVDGRHVSSFPYRGGFTLEDATGLYMNGDVEVSSILGASLPTIHPSDAPQKHLDLSERWRAPPIRDGPVELFIGILSAGSHFAERMAVRKSWMQHELIKSSRVVARFIVALNHKMEINIEVKKEAEFFGDIVIVPYMDHYDLVVLKTVAICEYGVRTVSADYVMKGDDDTFVRVDAIIEQAKKVDESKSLYIGNMNVHHKPLRSGKWAVTKEEWAERVYPTHAQGPGYIISSDIASFILSDFENNQLRLFKMEDVSMGMWIEKFNEIRPVEYVHSLKFCQFGCIEDYITAHYQSPRQMICLWNKLTELRKPSCCNMR